MNHRDHCIYIHIYTHIYLIYIYIYSQICVTKCTPHTVFCKFKCLKFRNIKHLIIVNKIEAKKPIIPLLCGTLYTISKNSIQIHVSLLQFVLNDVSTTHISNYLPQRSQYSDYIQEGQLSHKYQVDHKPEKEHITWLKNKHIIPLIFILFACTSVHV
jgi:hypothetical protein